MQQLEVITLWLRLEQQISAGVGSGLRLYEKFPPAMYGAMLNANMYAHMYIQIGHMYICM